jgi:hypothetical protein
MPSNEEDASAELSAEKRKLLTPAEWESTSRWLQCSVSYVTMVLLLDPSASIPPSGENATDVMPAHGRVRRRSCERASQITTPHSSTPMANDSPSGANHIEQQPAWLSKRRAIVHSIAGPSESGLLCPHVNAARSSILSQAHQNRGCVHT